MVTVRFCPNCGEIVNGKIPARRCSEEEHAKRRRARYTYCVDCGERLIQGR
jgi:rRNA maturation protein Nop10